MIARLSAIAASAPGEAATGSDPPAQRTTSSTLREFPSSSSVMASLGRGCVASLPPCVFASLRLGALLRLNRRLVVIELEIGQVGQEDREIEGEIPVGGLLEVERRPPLVKVAGQLNLLGFELAQGGVVLGGPAHPPEAGGREAGAEADAALIHRGQRSAVEYGGRAGQAEIDVDAGLERPPAPAQALGRLEDGVAAEVAREGYPAGRRKRRRARGARGGRGSPHQPEQRSEGAKGVAGQAEGGGHVLQERIELAALEADRPVPERMRHAQAEAGNQIAGEGIGDRKSTRLNSSHLVISYAVFCLKK